MPMKKSIIFFVVAVIIAIGATVFFVVGSNDDEEFKHWLVDSMDTINVDVQLLSSCNMDIPCINEYGARLKQDTEAFLEEIDDFTLSSKMEYVRQEYKDSLLDFMKAGNGLEHADSVYDVSNALEDAQSALDHWDNITSYAGIIARTGGQL